MGAYPRLTVEDVKACPEYAQGGYAPLNLPELIETLRPQVVLISLSADNRDSLPNQETLEAVEGYRLQHTDLNSWLRLSTVGT